MPTRIAEETEGAIWGRLFDPSRPNLSPEAARSILDLDFPREDKERMRALAAKARAGTLAAQEQEEIDAYGRVGSLLSILKSRARQALKKLSQSNGPIR